jgi:Ni,Fe-hydrogenase III small subunit/ferredoxin
MSHPFFAVARAGIVTQREIFPQLGPQACGLPAVTAEPCLASDCAKCAAVCPTQAITFIERAIALDRGLCIGCNNCVKVCPTGTLVEDRTVKTAVRRREDLVLSQGAKPGPRPAAGRLPFRRSLHVREVSTGDNASDAEVSASTNAVFDVSRFGISFVASPRFADALVVTGPVGLAMQEPLRRCYDAMAEPRVVIAVGASAISGGLHRGGYAKAEGVANVLPVASYVPGDPPHPWSIIHGLLLAMGRR